MTEPQKIFYKILHYRKRKLHPFLAITEPGYSHNLGCKIPDSNKVMNGVFSLCGYIISI